MILNEIINFKKKELAETKRRLPLPEVKALALDSEAVRAFDNSISGNDRIGLIAEVKKASPSKGVILEDFDPVKIAKIYERSGASCISVLTEQKYFQGKLAHLMEIRKAVQLPLLRKDFIIDEYQIFESRGVGADAILLISACLDKQQIVDYMGIARQLKLAVLVESHTYQELDKALLAGAMTLGINNRDLRTFKVDLRTTLDLLKDIPDSCTVVSESGISTREDVVTLQQAGVDAILVGESLMREKDIGNKIKEILGVKA